MLLADIDFMDVFWSMLWFFFLFMWIMILFHIIGDLFRDHEESGAMKAVWIIALVILPFLTALIYMIVRGKGMTERSLQAQADAQKQFNEYVQSVSAGGSSADQIAKGKELLDSGAISQAEFDALKAKALA
jgi:hypothetical protein